MGLGLLRALAFWSLSWARQGLAVTSQSSCRLRAAWTLLSPSLCLVLDFLEEDKSLPTYYGRQLWFLSRGMGHAEGFLSMGVMNCNRLCRW